MPDIFDFPEYAPSGEYTLVSFERMMPNYHTLKWEPGSYLFLFRTIRNPLKDEVNESHCIIQIAIVEKKSMKLYSQAEEANKLYFEKKNLVINEHIEIIEEEFNSRKAYVAVVKNSIDQCLRIRKRRILLWIDNGGYYDNLDDIEFGPDFKVQIKLLEVENQERKLKITIDQITLTSYKSNTKMKEYMDKVIGRLTEEMEQLHKESWLLHHQRQRLYCKIYDYLS